MTAPEVREDAAPPDIDEGYQRIRALLGSTFVPTVYRRLAVHPAAFDLAVDHLPEIVSLGARTDFVRAAQSTARIPAGGASVEAAVIRPEVVDVVERYRRANPLNLLFSMSIAGVAARPAEPVMELTAAPSPEDIWQDILASHGGVITPGLWRDLAPWPDSLQPLWLTTRTLGQDGRLARARAAVHALAATVLSGTGLARLPDRLAPLLPPSALSDLAWFPMGVSTMVAEGEWLHTLIANPTGRNIHEQA